MNSAGKDPHISLHSYSSSRMTESCWLPNFMISNKYFFKLWQKLLVGGGLISAGLEICFQLAFRLSSCNAVYWYGLLFFNAHGSESLQSLHLASYRHGTEPAVPTRCSGQTDSGKVKKYSSNSSMAHHQKNWNRSPALSLMLFSLKCLAHVPFLSGAI